MKKTILLFLTFILLLTLPANTQTIYKSVAAGNWTTTATWNISTDGGTTWNTTTTVPGNAATDIVWIYDNYTVTFNSSTTIAALTVGDGTNVCTLQYENTVTVHSLTITGDVTVATKGTFKCGSQSSAVVHTLILGGNLFVNGTGTFNMYGSNTNKSVQTTFNSSSSNVTISGTASTVTFNDLIIFLGSSSVTITPAFLVTIKNGLTITTGKWIQNSSTTTVNGNWSIGANGILSVGGGTFTTKGGSCTCNGTISISSGNLNVGDADGNSLNATASTSNFSMSGGTVKIAARFFAYSATNTNTVSITGGVMTVCNVSQNSSDATFAIGAKTNFTMNNGTVILANENDGTGGDCKIYSGTVSGGTFQIGTQSISISTRFYLFSTPTLYNVTMINSTNGGYVSLSLSSDLTISGLLTLSEATFFLNGHNLTVNGSNGAINNAAVGTISASTGSSIDIEGTYTYSVNLIFVGTFTNFTLNNANATITLSSSFTMSGNFTLTSGTFNGISYNVTVGGNWTNSGTFNCGTGTVTFNGTAAQTIGGTVSTTFNNLTIANTSGGVSLNINEIVSGTLTLTSGDLITTSSYQLNFTTTAVFTGETATSGRLVGKAVMNTRSITTGALNFLSVNIATGTDNMGNITITRTTGTDGIITFGSNSGIQCNWAITVGTQPSNGRNVTFSWQGGSFDNGKTFNSTNYAQVWRSTDAGISYETVGNETDVSGSNLRQIPLTGVTQFSIWTVSDVNHPLPVNLYSFTSSVSLNNVILSWVTILENNNNGFEIYRCKKNSDITYSEWTKAGFVKGSGTTNGNTNYSFADKNLQTGKYKYKLKQIDYNGNYQYFSLDGVLEIAPPKNYSLLQNYPNPFNPKTVISYQLPVDSYVKLTVGDILGRDVKTLVNNKQLAGYYTVEFNSDNFASGTYFYRIIANSNGKDFIMTKKLVVIK